MRIRTLTPITHFYIIKEMMGIKLSSVGAVCISVVNFK